MKNREEVIGMGNEIVKCVMQGSNHVPGIQVGMWFSIINQVNNFRFGINIDESRIAFEIAVSYNENAY